MASIKVTLKVNHEFTKQERKINLAIKKLKTIDPIITVK